MCLLPSLLDFFLFQEIYFGCYQIPITTEDLKEYGLNEKGDTCLVPPPSFPGGDQLGKPDPVVDPREYRPFAVRITVAIHNLQAHLPMVNIRNFTRMGMKVFALLKFAPFVWASYSIVFFSVLTVLLM